MIYDRNMLRGLVIAICVASPSFAHELKETKSLAAGIGDVSSMSFSPDGTQLAAGSQSGKIKLWNLASLEETATFEEGRWITNILFTPDGRQLVFADLDSDLKLCDLSTNKVIRTFAGHERGCAALALTANGKVLASGSDDKTVRLWQMSTGEPLKATYRAEHPINVLAFSHDNRFLAIGAKDFLVLINPRDGTPVKTLDIKGLVTSLAFPPNGATLVSGNSNGKLQVWELAKESQKLAVDIPTFHGISVKFTSDGKALLSNSRAIASAVTQLWDAEKYQTLATKEWNSPLVKALAVNPKKNQFAISVGPNIKLCEIAP